MSPYPTVVMVVNAQYMEATYLLIRLLWAKSSPNSLTTQLSGSASRELPKLSVLKKKKKHPNK